MAAGLVVTTKEGCIGAVNEDGQTGKVGIAGVGDGEGQAGVGADDDRAKIIGVKTIDQISANRLLHADDGNGNGRAGTGEGKIERIIGDVVVGQVQRGDLGAGGQRRKADGESGVAAGIDDGGGIGGDDERGGIGAINEDGQTGKVGIAGVGDGEGQAGVGADDDRAKIIGVKTIDQISANRLLHANAGKRNSCARSGEGEVERVVGEVIVGQMQRSGLGAGGQRGEPDGKSGAAIGRDGSNGIGRHDERGCIRAINEDGQTGEIGIAGVGDGEREAVVITNSDQTEIIGSRVIDEIGACRLLDADDGDGDGGGGASEREVERIVGGVIISEMQRGGLGAGSKRSETDGESRIAARVDDDGGIGRYDERGCIGAVNEDGQTGKVGIAGVGDGEGQAGVGADDDRAKIIGVKTIDQISANRLLHANAGKRNSCARSGEGEVERVVGDVVVGQMQRSGLGAGGQRGEPDGKSGAAIGRDGSNGIGRHDERGCIRAINEDGQTGEIGIAGVGDGEREAGIIAHGDQTEIIGADAVDQIGANRLLDANNWNGNGGSGASESEIKRIIGDVIIGEVQRGGFGTGSKRRETDGESRIAARVDDDGGIGRYDERGCIGAVNEDAQAGEVGIAGVGDDKSEARVAADGDQTKIISADIIDEVGANRLLHADDGDGDGGGGAGESEG